MPRFDQYSGEQNIKMLLMGHSGSGKTGSLVSLAAAGYRVRILDLDNKAHIIRDFVTNPKSIYLRERPGLWTAEQAAQTINNISYVTITDGVNIRGSELYQKGDSWEKIGLMLNDWKDGDDKPGHVTNWGPKDILVFDSLSRYSDATMARQLSMRGMAGPAARQPAPTVAGRQPQTGTLGTNDYSAVYAAIRNLFQLLKSTEIRCNIIMTCHITFQEEAGPQTSANRPIRGYPQILGSRTVLSPQVSQYFAHSVHAVQVGTKRSIVTNEDAEIQLINPAPFSIKREYPLETGLAEYFRDYHAGLPKEEPPEQSSNVTHLAPIVA